MPTCSECGAWISGEYERVMSDNAGNASCPSCERSIR
ncbi:DUF7563 family protein [Halosimplex rubrum]